jgi:hypothetical protein
MIEGEKTFGTWTVRQIDATGKRAVVRCSKCETTRLFSIESLQDGSARRCDCLKRVAPVERENSFATSLAKDARVVAVGRHHGRR